MDLGKVGHGLVRELRFEIRNDGEKPYRIARVRSSCGCMKVFIDRAPIPSGEAREGRVEVRLGRGFGRFAKHVDIHSMEKGEQPLVLRVLAEFHPGLTIDKREIVLAGVVGKKIAEGRVEVSILRQQGFQGAVKLEELRIEGEGLEVSAADGPSAPRIVVSLSADHPEGRVHGRVVAQLNGLPLEIPIRGTVFQGIRIAPEQFNFSVVDDPSRATCQVSLIPADEHPFRVESVEVLQGSRGAKIKIEVETAPREQGGYTLSARLLPPYPQMGGSLSFHRVRVITSHPEKPSLEIRCLGHLRPKRLGGTPAPPPRRKGKP
ncbi:MAG: DUF1573 domain-containing protein [Planctomycetota bacterium]